MKTLYKKDSTGRLRYLTIDTDSNLVIQTSGIIDSPNPVIHKSECKGKNIGRSNETTPEQQAVSEAKSKIKKKLEEGYYETPEQATRGLLILPMLAADFKKEEKKVSYPCFVQPKLDGMRALKAGSDMISRKNKPITTMTHIANELLWCKEILDGELYAHGESFQRNMELIKKYRENESELVIYHVYDIVIENESFSERYKTLKRIVESSNLDYIKLVPTFEITTKNELLEKHKEFLEAGYEGTMVRHGHIGYQPNKRSSSLLKFKDFKDIACKIVDVKPSEKRPEHGSFICELPDGRTFGCGMRFSHEERMNTLLNKEEYIGKTAEIRFFEYTDEGLPRFPVCVGIRLDK